MIKLTRNLRKRHYRSWIRLSLGMKVQIINMKLNLIPTAVRAQQLLIHIILLVSSIVTEKSLRSWSLKIKHLDVSAKLKDSLKHLKLTNQGELRFLSTMELADIYLSKTSKRTSAKRWNILLDWKQITASNSLRKLSLLMNSTRIYQQKEDISKIMFLSNMMDILRNSLCLLSMI